jgi:hypothetical protein
MKRPDLKFIDARVLLARRQLRRMGFRDVADKASDQALLRLQPEPLQTRKPKATFIKIILAIIAILTLWLIFWHSSLLP